jgi:hypothetical protein
LPFITLRLDIKMPKFAQFDSTITAPQQVIGWYDTDELDYPVLPAAANLLTLTQAQWDGRFTTPFCMNGTLIATPALTTKQKLDNARAMQIITVTQACGTAIVAGFTSSALGAAYTYPSQRDDQTNLIGAVASGLANVPFWCADATGVWGIVPHSAAQIKQVLADGGTTRIGYSAKLAGLIASISAATTVTAVQAIVW